LPLHKDDKLESERASTEAQHFGLFANRKGVRSDEEEDLECLQPKSVFCVFASARVCIYCIQEGADCSFAPPIMFGIGVVLRHERFE
jgi:hypothetical protein